MRWAILSVAAAAALTLSAGDASAQRRGYGGYHGGNQSQFRGGYGNYRYNYPRYNNNFGSPRYNNNFGYRPGVSLFLGNLGLSFGSGYNSPWTNNYGWGNGYNPYSNRGWYRW